MERKNVNILKLEVAYAYGFQEGLAAVKIGGKWGFIDKTDKYVINPQFDETYGFQGSLADVKVDNKRGYIDKTGRYVWQGEAPVAAVEAPKVEAPVAMSVPPPAPATINTKIIGNSDTKRYHLPGMKYYNAVESYHRVEFDSEDDAIRAGYQKAPR